MIVSGCHNFDLFSFSFTLQTHDIGAWPLPICRTQDQILDDITASEGTGPTHLFGDLTKVIGTVVGGVVLLIVTWLISKYNIDVCILSMTFFTDLQEAW